MLSHGAWKSIPEPSFLPGSNATETSTVITTMSCPTATYCVGTSTNGYIYTLSSGTWSQGQQVDTNSNQPVEGFTGPGTNSLGQLTSISCPTTTFCAAVDNGGYAFIYSAGSWSAGQQIYTNGGSSTAILNGTVSAEINAVSCANPNFCIALDNGGTINTYSDGVWSSSQQVDNSGTWVAVSCAPTEFCVGVDASGSALIYSGGSWSAGQRIDTGPNGYGVLNSASCPTTGFCVVADQTGNVLNYASGTWSPPQPIYKRGGLNISCVTANFCMGISDGTVFEYR